MSSPTSPLSSLVIGYGNPDRQDDGLAWHILCGLAKRLGRPCPTVEEGFAPQGTDPDLLFVLQLTPELSETIAAYQRVCFVDAHTGAPIPTPDGEITPAEIQATRLEPKFQSSPLTHHMPPETVLALAAGLYAARPEALLVSIQGDAFEFSHTLSDGAQARLQPAIEVIYAYICKNGAGT